MPLSERHARGQRAAGLHLRLLLSRVGQYREVWEARARATEPDEINQRAVCQAIAEYLWDSGERAEGDHTLPRRLKDRVNRCLAGNGLSLETLLWFERAFRLSPHDSQRVRELFRGATGPTNIVGGLTPPDPASGIRLPPHDITLLFDHHVIGRAGLPVHHHSQMTIRSRTDGLASYQYRMDTSEATVRVQHGGTAGPIYPIADGYHACDITFAHPLRDGEEHYLDFWTRLRYSQPPPPEFRRGTLQVLQHLEMRIKFHREKLPRRLWWAEWRDYRGADQEIAYREDARLDEEYSAHRYLEAIERAIVGFCWEWL